jgi:hypothetical protein
MSLGDVIKRIFGGRPDPEEELVEQEEYGTPDPGVTELRSRPVDLRGGDVPGVVHELDELKPPRDPNP